MEMAGLESRRAARPDGALAKRAAAGDSEAWAELVDRYAAYIRTLLASTRMEDQDIPDSVQYVFIELHKALPNLRSTEILAPWIRKTTLRHAIRERERKSRLPGSLEDIDWEPAAAEFEPDILRAEESQTIREAVSALKPKCRELVEALFFEDPPRPYADVAESLGIKTASVAMTRQRCLETLERALSARGIR